MIKKINPASISFLLEIAISKGEIELEKGFRNWPDDPNGVEVDWVNLKNHFDSLVFQIRNSIEALLGELPEGVNPDIALPEGEMPNIDIPDLPAAIIETGNYHGRHDINNRPIWYFSKKMKDYPLDFDININGCGVMKVRENVGKRFDYDEQYDLVGYNKSRDRSFVRQSLVEGRGMVVVGSRQCKSMNCVLTSVKRKPQDITAITHGTTEYGRYHGRHNGDRPMWYFDKPMRDYPRQFVVVVDDCVTIKVTSNNGIRFESGHTIVKQSDVSGRGMAIITSAACHSEKCHIVMAAPAEAESYNTIDVVNNLRFMHDKAFAWLPYTGAAYGRSAKFVWPELGKSFIVPNMSDNYSPLGQFHESYFCGTKNTPETSNGKRASIFGPAGLKASFLEIHYNK